MGNQVYVMESVIEKNYLSEIKCSVILYYSR